MTALHEDCAEPCCWADRLAQAGGPTEIDGTAVTTLIATGDLLLDANPDHVKVFDLPATADRLRQLDELHDAIDMDLATEARWRFDDRAEAVSRGAYDTLRQGVDEVRADAHAVTQKSVTLALRAGLSVTQVAQYLGMDEAELAKFLTRGRTDDLDPSAKAEAMLRDGATLRSVARSTGMHVDTVRHMAVRLGVPIRLAHGGIVPKHVLRRVDELLTDGFTPADALARVVVEFPEDSTALTITNVRPRASRLRRRPPK